MITVLEDGNRIEFASKELFELYMGFHQRSMQARVMKMDNKWGESYALVSANDTAKSFIIMRGAS